MRRFEVDDRYHRLYQFPSLIAVLIAGCIAPRAEVKKPVEKPIPSVAKHSPSVNPIARPELAARLVSHQVERLPAPSEPALMVAPPSTDRANPVYPGTKEVVESAGQPLTLPDAIALAFQSQPRLRVYLEGIQQAQGRSDIAFAPFLPTVATGYSVGGFDLNVGGSLPSFTVLPPGFALPVGLNIQTGYELAELRLQYLICDFGRRRGLYNASRLTIDVHQLQTDRAYQTVANEVALAYYNVLRTQALLRIAQESVLRDEDERDVAQKLAKSGVIEREKLLRAEVQLAESRRSQDASEEGVAIAMAALNLAIGLKREGPIPVVEPIGRPDFAASLPDCLQIAITQRREFAVARRAIQVAQEGTRVARADFAPRVVAEGDLYDLQQSSPRGHADIALAFIKLEWNLYEGGKRVGEQRIADSKVREAMAQAESIADTIAFQVNEAFRRVTTARLGIERAHPAGEQATENYRLVRARAASGDATQTEITDAETALTRAQQNYLNSTYDYLSALAKLDYVTGAAPTPSTAALAHRGP
jgi:outer membrane protein